MKASGSKEGPALQAKPKQRPLERPQPRETSPQPVNPTWQLIALGAQAKLVISSPDDPLESEADRVAGSIVGSSDAVSSPSIAPGHAGGPAQLQREDIPVEEATLLQPKSLSGSQSANMENVESGVQRLQGRGEPLGEDTRTFFEPRFSADLSGVCIHADGEASSLARAVNARAFTLGHNIVFANGQYAPETQAGKMLLAHELTHTVQQGAVAKNPDAASNDRDVVSVARATDTLQRDPADGEKHYLIEQVTISGDPFKILLQHKPIDGAMHIRVSYEGKEDSLPKSVNFMVKDAKLKSPVDKNTYYLMEGVTPPGGYPLHRVVYSPYKDRTDADVVVGDGVMTNDKWVPPRRNHQFFGELGGVETINKQNTDIEIIPHESIPATVTEPEYADIVIPQVAELSPSQALIAARITLQEILDNKDLYQLQFPELLDKLKGELDERNKKLDSTADNSEAAQTGTSIVRAADYFKQKVPSVALLLMPGYFPSNIADEATTLVRDVHSDYEFGLNFSNGTIEKTNAYYKRADHKLLRLQFRLGNLFLKR